MNGQYAHAGMSLMSSALAAVNGANALAPSALAAALAWAMRLLGLAARLHGKSCSSHVVA